MLKNNINKRITYIKGEVGSVNNLVVKKFIIGKEYPMDAYLIYMETLVDKNIINESILKPLMIYADETYFPKHNLPEYLSKKYLAIGDISIEDEDEIIIKSINDGKSVLFVAGYETAIILNTKGGEFRSITDPQNESSVRGTREGFVENLETNISIIKRKIPDKNLKIETLKIGDRSQTNVSIIFIEDIAKPEIVEELKRRLHLIDVDYITGIGEIEQYIEEYPYSPFPQFFSTERPDIIVSSLMEGQIVLFSDGTPFTLVVPSIMTQFFQAVEDYYQRTLVSSFVRILRVVATIVVILLPSTYLTLISYNVELIPIKFLTPIIQSRQGIALSPLLEILSMEVIIEFLREGGLRLPPKIAGTLSIVGGIIIGNAAIDSNLASPSTLLIVGISTVASFTIPNYEMAVSIRFLRFPMLLLADALGFLGIAIGSFLILIHIFSIKNFGVDYLKISKKDFKDIFIRAPLWAMNNRPNMLPNTNSKRQIDFRKLFRRKKHGKRQ